MGPRRGDARGAGGRVRDARLFALLMLSCAYPSCGKKWTKGADIPACPEITCPLRDEIMKSRRAPWVASEIARSRLGQRTTSPTTSILQIQKRIRKKHRFAKYSMDGKQKAMTKVRMRRRGKPLEFSTSEQMHSEMRAVEKMLESGEWRLFLGQILWAHNFQPVDPSDFVTGEPHCGYCTFFLHILGLPIGTATKGNYNFAGNFQYPLPEKVKKDVYVLARVLDQESYSGFHKIKALLNDFVSIDSSQWLLNVKNFALVDEQSYTVITKPNISVLKWDEIVQKDGGAIVNELWRLIFQCLYEANRKG